MAYRVGDKVSFVFNHAVKTGEIVAIGMVDDTVTIDSNKNYYVIPRYDVLGRLAFHNLFDQFVQTEPERVEIQEQEPEKTPEEIERERLRNFFFGSSPELSGLGRAWKAQGRCPVCGQEGRIHLSTFVCSKHGTY